MQRSIPECPGFPRRDPATRHCGRLTTKFTHGGPAVSYCACLSMNCAALVPQQLTFDDRNEELRRCRLLIGRIRGMKSFYEEVMTVQHESTVELERFPSGHVAKWCARS